MGYVLPRFKDNPMGKLYLKKFTKEEQNTTSKKVYSTEDGKRFQDMKTMDGLRDKYYKRLTL